MAYVIREDSKVWEQRQGEKGYLTWQEYLEAVEGDDR